MLEKILFIWNELKIIEISCNLDYKLIFIDLIELNFFNFIECINIVLDYFNFVYGYSYTPINCFWDENLFYLFKGIDINYFRVIMKINQPLLMDYWVEFFRSEKYQSVPINYFWNIEIFKMFNDINQVELLKYVFYNPAGRYISEDEYINFFLSLTYGYDPCFFNWIFYDEKILDPKFIFSVVYGSEQMGGSKMLWEMEMVYLLLKANYCLNGNSIYYQRNFGHYLIDIKHVKFFFFNFFYLFLIFFTLIYNTIKAKYRSYMWASNYRATLTSIWVILFFLIFMYCFNANFLVFWLFIKDIVFYSYPFLGFYETIIFDYYSVIIKMMVLILTLLILLISLNYIRYDCFEEWEYPILLLFSVFGIFCLLSSFNFLVFFICLEFLAIASYFLTAIKKYDPLGSEAGIKYFVLGSMASFFLSFGIALLYGFFGSLAFVDIKYEILLLYYYYLNSFYSSYINVLLICGVICITITFLFKMSSAPFHFWTPDVYEGSPLVVTSFFAIVIKFSILTSFLRIFYYLFKYLDIYIQPILIVGSVISMLIGSIGGLYQRKIKRLFAYSTITHIGYLLMSVATFTFLGLKGSLIYVIVYSITMLGIFTYLVLSRNYFSCERLVYLNDLRTFGVHQNNWYYTFVLIILIFSLAGIPPLAGFYAKWYVFQAAIDINLWELAFVGIFSSLISCFYYLHLIKIIIFENVELSLMIYNVNKMEYIILTFSMLFSILFSFFGSYFVSFVEDLSYTLLYPFQLGILKDVPLWVIQSLPG